MAAEQSHGGGEAAASFRASVASRVAAFKDHPTHRITKGAQALVEGKLGAWVLFTNGLIVNGTNPTAIRKLLEAKNTDPQKIVDGSRSLVSVLPDRKHRQGLIDINRYVNPNIRKALEGPDTEMLTQEGQPLFYKVFAGDAPYLQPPLVRVEKNGDRTIVLLWHNNKRLQQLDLEMRKLAHGAVLLTGSSANKTGDPQALFLHDLDPDVSKYIEFSVSARDKKTHTVPTTKRGSIPMIDLTMNEPRVIREGMYPALPKNNSLRKLLLQDPQLIFR